MLRTLRHCLLAFAMLCIASVVTTGCGVTGDLYLPEQAGAQDTPESQPESPPEKAPESTTETLPDTTE